MTNMQKDRWPEADIQRLRQLWCQGLSAAQISQAFEGRYSRNGVCGKAHRMGLDKRNPAVSRGYQAREKKAAAPVKSKPLPANVTAPEPIGLREDFPSDRTTCRAIHGDLMQGGVLCGHAGYPWCEFHAGRYLTKPLTTNLRAPK